MGICSDDLFIPQQTNCVRVSLSFIFFCFVMEAGNPKKKKINKNPTRPWLFLATEPSADRRDASLVSGALAAAAPSQLTWCRFLSGQQAAGAQALAVNYENICVTTVFSFFRGPWQPRDPDNIMEPPPEPPTRRRGPCRGEGAAARCGDGDVAQEEVLVLSKCLFCLCRWRLKSRASNIYTHTRQR